MKKTAYLTILLAVIMLGCARLNVGGSKESIKLDIAMRLDIYQHVEKDIDSIENIVSGEKPKAPKKSGGQSLLNYWQRDAFAQETLSPEVEQAALRRKARRDTLASWKTKAVIGENKAGLIEVRNPGGADSSVSGLVQAENSDRMVIYRSLAQKYGETVEQIQKLYAEKMAKHSPAGTPVESLSGEWTVK